MEKNNKVYKYIVTGIKYKDETAKISFKCVDSEEVDNAIDELIRFNYSIKIEYIH